MKKSIVATALCLVILASALPASAQQSPPVQPTQSEKIIVDVSELPPEVVAQIKAKQHLQTASEYAKWGREVGEAMDGALSAITRHASEFGKTDVGQFTMFLVAWKIMARDVFGMMGELLGATVGIPFLAIGCFVLIWSYRRLCMPRRILVERQREGFWKVTKKYEIYNPDAALKEGRWGWGREGWAIAHAILFCVVVIISSTMIF